ncbi:MAG: MBL fold metallo-hydrolase [Treponema sp.]|jgi:glyoxylase-like metal-dependent hydrolase (beta-lactamase superfamily II)|nr:MBL fold metallo-hydrolase [Treponema sp.]
MPNKNITNLVVGSIETNCWIYPIDEKQAVVIDPGDEADKIISVLKKLDLAPVYILLTHGHFDHIAAVPDLIEKLGPSKPQIAVHRLDAEYLGHDAYNVHAVSIKAAMGSSSFIDTFWRDMPQADIILEEGSDVGPFTVLHLPGHTSGSIAFWDKAEGVLFTGDTLFNYAYGRTDLPGGNENDIFSSLRRLFEMDGNIKVYPGHGSTTTIDLERRQTARLL